MTDDKQPVKKMSIIVSRGSLDGIYPALIMANGARMEGIEASLFFTFFGLNALANKTLDSLKVSTVGNSALAPNNFNGNIVNGFDFGIYVGEVTTQPLDNTLLVKNSAHFEFAGFGGFDLSQVSPHVVFGFGTNPDCIITVPEPGTMSLAAFGLLAALPTLRRQRSGGPPASVQGTNALEICGV